MSKEKHRMRVVDAEVIDVNAPFSEAGNFPAVRQNLRESLSESLGRCKNAAEELKKICVAQAELMESAVDDAKRAYVATRDEIRKMGV